MAQAKLEIKRGEYIYKEGEPANKLFLVESGRVEIVIERGSNKIKLYELGSSQIVGEAALFGQRNHTSSCIALQNTRIMEIPTEVIKKQMESANGILKVILKSMTDQMKLHFSDLKSLKMEKETSPMPEMHIPQVFGLINLISLFSGEEKEDHLKVGWGSLKNYTMKMFLEAPDRVENALKILKKLGYVDLEYTLSEGDDGEEQKEELTNILIYDPQVIQDFPEFYAYHLYKPGKSEILYINKKCMFIAQVLSENYGEIEKDHRGATNVPFQQVIDDMTKVGVSFTNSDLSLLEGKGLFVTQKNPEKGEPLLSFDYDEIHSTSQFWGILNEIEKWNTSGTVSDAPPDRPTASQQSGDISCPECSTALSSEQKFCHECGHKIKAVA